MIRQDGRMVVYLATVDYGPDEGGDIVLSVHDTIGGAIEALVKGGYRPSCVWGSRGEVYAYRGKTADEFPQAVIVKREVMP